MESDSKDLLIEQLQEQVKQLKQFADSGIPSVINNTEDLPGNNIYGYFCMIILGAESFLLYSIDISRICYSLNKCIIKSPFSLSFKVFPRELNIRDTYQQYICCLEI